MAASLKRCAIAEGLLPGFSGGGGVLDPGVAGGRVRDGLPIVQWGERGQGIASRAMVTVSKAITAEIVPTVSLYVNDYNVAAVRVYEKAGFETVGMYSTILL